MDPLPDDPHGLRPTALPMLIILLAIVATLGLVLMGAAALT